MTFDFMTFGFKLNICFEFESEKQSFNKNGGHFNFDSKKQKKCRAYIKQRLPS